MISSHILSELEEICNQVGIIESGKLVFSGTMDEIRHRMGIQSRIKVRVADQPQLAVELLIALPQIQDASLAGDYIAVTFNEGADGDGVIARTLVQGNVDVISLEPEQLKLDDAFLQLTKGIVN
ncbi:MAG: ABC transporter ATP-binding protein, partial [Phycisphaerae bacterium]|nr:ABC transporter ATP-binding protein [Phycisphaerae bacterium]